MKALKFTGWVDKVLDGNDYEKRVAVRNYKDDDHAAQLKADKSWPITLMFTLSVKNGCAEQLKGIVEGDKVNVTYYLSGKSGISKKTGMYYCINSCNVAKTDGLVLLERGSTQEAKAGSDDPLPF